MADEDFVNSQVKESVNYANYNVLGNAPSQSNSMLDALMAETIGMAMYNAVNTQHNSQMISSAAVTAACAKMLKVQAVPWIPAPAPPPVPTVTGIAAVTSPATTYTVSGTNFAPNLIAVISQGATIVTTLSGSAITAIKPVSFTMLAPQLTVGQNYTMQVINPDQTISLPYSFTAPQPPPAAPTVTGVAPVQGQPNMFTVSGTNFAAGLSAVIAQGATVVDSASGSAITNIVPASFTMQTTPLTAGQAYTVQVINANKTTSAPFSFTAPAAS